MACNNRVGGLGWIKMPAGISATAPYILGLAVFTQTAPTTLYLHRLTTRSACPPGLAGSRLKHAWWRKNRLFKVNTSCDPAGRSSFISGELKDGWDSICLWRTGALLWPPRMPPWTASEHFPDSYRRLSSQFQFSLSAVTLGYLSQWTAQRHKEAVCRLAYPATSCAVNNKYLLSKLYLECRTRCIGQFLARIRDVASFWIFRYSFIFNKYSFVFTVGEK